MVVGYSSSCVLRVRHCRTSCNLGVTQVRCMMWHSCLVMCNDFAQVHSRIRHVHVCTDIRGKPAVQQLQPSHRSKWHPCVSWQSSWRIAAWFQPNTLMTVWFCSYIINLNLAMSRYAFSAVGAGGTRHYVVDSCCVSAETQLRN